jgi:hypothetical protein
MREVAPGDLISSFVDTRILAVGIAQSYCWESPKPRELGNAGQNWEDVGWKVKVNFGELANNPITSMHAIARGRRAFRKLRMEVSLACGRPITESADTDIFRGPVRL